MKLPIYQIDAFTSRVFRGNPAAVVLLDAWPADEILQGIALENNLSETAFVIPREDVSALRWFTPMVEVDLCGHATLAAGYVLFNYLYPSLSRIQFSSRSGVLGVSREGERLCLDFPANAATAAPVPGIKEALGVEPVETLVLNGPASVIAVVAVFDNDADVLNLHPNFERVRELNAFMLIATSRGRADTDVDYVSRVFAPGTGIPEDPATGSAHCILLPYWAGRLGKSVFHARQLSARGGEFMCELRGSRVSISGTAVEYLRGEIHVG